MWHVKEKVDAKAERAAVKVNSKEEKSKWSYRLVPG